MLMYAKVTNEETKECDVGLNDPAVMFDENITVGEWYESIGMTLQDVDQAYNGRWYLIDYVPEQPLDKLKAKKRIEINKARDKAEQGGFEYLGKVFDSDQVSCIRMSSAAQAMQLAPDDAVITWTCQDNTTIDLNKTQILGLVVALAQWSNTCHEKATSLKAQIDACESKEELDKIVWE